MMSRRTPLVKGERGTCLQGRSSDIGGHARGKRACCADDLAKQRVCGVSSAEENIR